MNTKIYQKIIIGIIVVTGTLIFTPNSLAENCPATTTVSGTSIIFVGGLADMGGDTQSSVWFEYGTTPGSYTQKTTEKVLSQLGKYCTTVPNLQPCATYYYRAAMRNNSGPSYGAEQSRTIACSAVPPVTSPVTPEVLGAATEAPTGLTNNFLTDSFFLPLVIISVAAWFLKPYIIKGGYKKN